MEVIRNYPEMEEIIGVIKRIADNLDEMTRIMEIKNTRKMTPKELFTLNSMYGVMAARPLPDYDPEILRAELQKTKERYKQAETDLKDLELENDRLKKRDEITYDFISSIACTGKICRDCKLYRPDLYDELGAKCSFLQGPAGYAYIRKTAYQLKKKLEDL